MHHSTCALACYIRQSSAQTAQTDRLSIHTFTVTAKLGQKPTNDQCNNTVSEQRANLECVDNHYCERERAVVQTKNTEITASASHNGCHFLP